MLKLIEDGLFSASYAKNSAFKKFSLSSHNANDGTVMFRRAMVVNVAGQPIPTETFGLGVKTYTFVASGATGDQINIGADHETTTDNIIIKINADTNTVGCTAYPLGKAIYILLVENVAGNAPLFTALGTKIVQVLAWNYNITEATLENTDYFKVDATVEESAIPVVLSERNVGTKDNFLY